MVQERVVVVGGGVGGLASALAFARAGHPVTILDRDVLPQSGDADEAFAAERRGAPQVHQTHGFLARIVVELRNHFPDVLDALHAVGGMTMPARANLGEPRPGDEDFAVLIIRRTTFEWVLRNAVLAEPGVEMRTGVGVKGLRASNHASLEIPLVDGVVLEDGSVLDADIVVAATGRRGPVPQWLEAIGVRVEEQIVESGLMYLSRWYNLDKPISVDEDAKLGGDLGFVKFLGVPGDGNTVSVTLAIRSDDSELRSVLSTVDGFEGAVRALPGPDYFFKNGPLDPIGDVRPMGGLLNRLRTFVDASGEPLVAGFHAVGDSHTCTNPLYGRGCSLALVQGIRLAQAAAEHPGDPVARARAYEAISKREVEPWFHVSVEMDKAGADPNGAGAFGGGGPDEGKGLAAVFAAAATDPIIGRAITRYMNLLSTPEELASDPEFLVRVAQVMADPDSIDIPPRVGPSRRELLDVLTHA